MSERTNSVLVCVSDLVINRTAATFVRTGGSATLDSSDARTCFDARRPFL